METRSYHAEALPNRHSWVMRVHIMSLVLGCVALSACQPVPQMPNHSLSAIRPSAVASESAAVTRVTDQPMVSPDTRSTVTIPMPTLPMDQPWFLMRDDDDPCDLNGRGKHLIALDSQGQQTLFGGGITAITKRLGLPPLLAVCTPDGRTVLVDPVDGWTSMPLPLEPGAVLTQFALSPDRTNAILDVLLPTDDSLFDEPSYLLDLHTGALRPVNTIPTSSGHGGPYSTSVTVRFLGWSSGGLYLLVVVNKAGGTTVEVFDPTVAESPLQELVRNSPHTLNIAHEILVVVNNLSSSSSLTVSDLRQGTSQIIDQAGGFSQPTISPDGTALVYFRSDQNSANHDSPRFELVTFGLTGHTQTIISDSFGIPIEIFNDTADIPVGAFWSQDSQRIIAVTNAGHGDEVSLFDLNGTLLNRVPFPWSYILGVTSDDQLVLTEPGVWIRWLPLRPGASPYIPYFAMGHAWYDLAYLP